MTLTPRESDVLCEIRWHLNHWGEPPTRLELSQTLGISRPTVELHLQRMARKGVLTLVKRWRGISLHVSSAPQNPSPSGGQLP